MILVDSGPLIAIIDQADKYHNQCVAISKRLPVAPFVTTWPCLTESMHFLGRVGGFPVQQNLWELVKRGVLLLDSLTDKEIGRMAHLMDIYQNVPMDIADASLIVKAETLGLTHLFTIDSDFYIYRMKDSHILLPYE
ncbi:MAG TPA: PIN domain nuclease [Anaerolineae bacterium]|nr:PIN domain nuclease [Anaerolineae bacterium]